MQKPAASADGSLGQANAARHPAASRLPGTSRRGWMARWHLPEPAPWRAATMTAGWLHGFGGVSDGQEEARTGWKRAEEAATEAAAG